MNGWGKLTFNLHFYIAMIEQYDFFRYFQIWWTFMQIQDVEMFFKSCWRKFSSFWWSWGLYRVKIYFQWGNKVQGFWESKSYLVGKFQVRDIELDQRNFSYLLNCMVLQSRKNMVLPSLTQEISKLAFDLFIFQTNI